MDAEAALVVLQWDPTLGAVVSAHPTGAECQQIHEACHCSMYTSCGSSNNLHCNLKCKFHVYMECRECYCNDFMTAVCSLCIYCDCIQVKTRVVWHIKCRVQVHFICHNAQVCMS